MRPRRPRIALAVTASRSSVLVRPEAEFLARASWEVLVLGSPGPEWAWAERMEGVRFVGVPMGRDVRPVTDGMALFSMRRALASFAPDVVCAGTPKAGLLAAVAGASMRHPVMVYMVRGLRFESESGWKRTVLTAAERISCRLADRVLCVSRSVADVLSRSGITAPSKTVVLGRGSASGVDTRLFRPPTEESRLAQRRRFGIPSDGVAVGFAGRIRVDKGIPDLVSAIDHLRAQGMNVHLALLGVVEGSLRLPARDWIRVVEWQEETLPFYQAIDVFALPTYREGLPSVLLEAQAVGLPVVTTMATGAIDAVRPDETGHVVPVGDALALAHAIGRLASDVNERRRMGEQGRRWVMSEFERADVLRRYEAYYRSMIEADEPRLPTTPAPPANGGAAAAPR